MSEQWWEEQLTYAVGHLALGYLSGKVTSKVLNVNLNIPLLFLASVMPDVDLLIPGLQHQGPTHSLIIFCLLFLPAFFLSGKRVAPYLVALAQHSLIGDCLTGGTQMLWPVATNWYGLGIKITSPTNILIEWILFLASTALMLKTKDAWLLSQRHLSNLTLSIPVLTVLIPTFLSFPLPVSTELIIPHLTYLTVFSFSAIIYFIASSKANKASW